MEHRLTAIEAEKGSLEFNEIMGLQRQFDRTFGRETDPLDLLLSSYNPVFDRWHVNRLRKAGDTEGLEQLRQEIVINQRTNLMERLHVVESHGKFLIKEDGKLYAEFYQKEPMGQVMLRGANTRADENSMDKDREGWLGELQGWKKLQDTMVNSPIGTKMISFSPPSDKKGSAYYGRFVDIYESADDGEGKYVKRTRLAVDYDDRNYKEMALTLDPTFFDGYDGRSLDAWYLSHPVVVDSIPIEMTKKGMSLEDFNALYTKIEGDNYKLISHYLDVLYAENIDWEELALSFNAILNAMDHFQENQTETTLPGMPSRRLADVSGISQATAAIVAYLGRQEVKVVTGGGCPPSKGINVTNGTFGQYSWVDKGLDDPLANSVAQWGISKEKKWDYHDGNCVVCKGEGLQVGPCSICKECEKTF